MTRRPPPPTGPPWDLPLAEAPLVFVDLEMTGLKVDADRVIEICAELWIGDACRERMCTLVDPHPAPIGNEHIHGITAAELAGAPPFAAIADELVALLRSGIVIAHAAGWDVSFLETELRRAERPTAIPHYLDTLRLSRRAFHAQSHALDALCTEFEIERSAAHRASDDVRALRAVFARVVERLQPATPRDLWHVRPGERGVRPDVWAAIVAACERQTPVFVRYRPAGKASVELHFVPKRLETTLDPPRVLGYLLPSRGRRELRADRILSVSDASEVAERPPSER